MFRGGFSGGSGGGCSGGSVNSGVWVMKWNFGRCFVIMDKCGRNEILSYLLLVHVIRNHIVWIATI